MSIDRLVGYMMFNEGVDSYAYIGAVLHSWSKLLDKVVILCSGNADAVSRRISDFGVAGRVIVVPLQSCDVVLPMSICPSRYVALLTPYMVLYEDQEHRIHEHMSIPHVSAVEVAVTEFVGDHYHVADNVVVDGTNGDTDEYISTLGFGNQAIRYHRCIYTNHGGLVYDAASSCCKNLSSGIVVKAPSVRVADYSGALLSYELSSNAVGRSVIPLFGSQPLYMMNHERNYRRVSIVVDSISGTYIVDSCTDGPIKVDITKASPGMCGRPQCNYEPPVIDAALKVEASKYTAITALDYYTSTAELCAIHPNVFVNMNENIPFNTQYAPEVRDRIENIIHINARHFIAVSTATKDALIMEGVPPERISVINFWGCDTDTFKPLLYDNTTKSSVLSRYNVPYCAPIILYVGRIEMAKGIGYLLKALRYIEAAHIVLCGSGDFNSFIGYIPHGQQHRVHYIGHICDKYQLAELYNAADMLVLPSIPTEHWVEQFGRVLVEANACCVPVIATNMGGPLDIVEHGYNGYLVNPFSPGEIAHYANELINDPHKRITMGINGRIRVMGRFSDTVTKQMYDECIKAHLQ